MNHSNDHPSAVCLTKLSYWGEGSKKTAKRVTSVLPSIAFNLVYVTSFTAIPSCYEMLGLDFRKFLGRSYENFLSYYYYYYYYYYTVSYYFAEQN